MPSRTALDMGCVTVLAVCFTSNEDKCASVQAQPSQDCARSSDAPLVAAFVGCCKKSEVTGEVIDGFGMPLPAAAISVSSGSHVFQSVTPTAFTNNAG